MSEISRRDENAAATRAAIVAGAIRLFSEDGYARASMDRIAASARVTKGAAYHYFPAKRELFLAALEAVDERTMTAIAEATASARSPWDAVERGLDAFLDRCLDVDYQRICFRDGPGALGFVPWWEHAESHVHGVLTDVIGALRTDESIAVADTTATATALYGSLTAAALAITRSADPRQTRDAMGRTILALLHGLRPAHAGA
ncbi:helix-turn-helix domain containing protein [Tsukamurella sp. 8F]|uniref:TetR/AcrR family transcriptional regulator n=1 Tax=unclassified Tsukamurella TaxID=2633480 RepID=UPI0023B8AE8D|nr:MULTISPECIES: TetR/AcrR family transcriptional regulator [unclassified Tsukamurella]MDF0531068.1 helix-turn-helix domain containing protein [Tsukamurella sp. 8J]MDF0585465.1 helix-turn-helix domain containing protein [Tsukamurella sp. 8F]